MKKLLMIGFASLVFIACENEPVGVNVDDKIAAEGVEEFTCVNAQADSLPTLDEAKERIVGKWQLKGMITMMPVTEVPNIQIEFKEDGGVFVSLAGENVYTDAYSVIESEENETRLLKLIGDNLMTQSEYAIAKGNLRICEKEMLIDHGIAFDAPGYLFRKIQ
jgi:hypothetical protein